MQSFLYILFLTAYLFWIPSYIHAQTAVKVVTPALETTNCRNAGDVCDDSAIWIHPTDPSQSVIIGDDKNGGMLVWDLQGRELQYIDSNLLMNNVDIRYNFPLSGTYSTGQAHTSVALVVVGAENANALQVYKVNPTTRKLENVSSISLSINAPYGGCMYRSPVSGKYYYFVNWKSGVWQQIELRSSGNTVAGTSVRTGDAGGQTEGCVADDVNKYYYIGEEAVGVHRYGAEPGDSNINPVKVSGSEQTADTEGMSLYYKSDGTGYLIVSSQGDSSYSVYNRIPPSASQPNALVGRFKVGANGGVDDVSSTDGLDVTNFALGSAFPQGLLVVHDASNGGTSNHKLVPFQNIASQLGLSMDTSWDPRKVGDGGGGGGGGGGLTPTIPVATPTTILPTNNNNNVTLTVTVPPGTNCAKKNIGDADCKADPFGRSINVFDYAIWYSEFIGGCSSTNSTGCGTDADGNGNPMDANFNYPGTSYISTDTIINSFDYAVWIQGMLSQTEVATPTPTIGNTAPTSTPTPATTTGTITPTSGPVPTGTQGKGIWISKEEIAALPASGSAWDNIKTAASGNSGSSALYNQESKHPQYTLAAALVAAKKGASEMCGFTTCQNKAVAGVMDILDDGPTTGGGDGRVLALGRNLAPYIVAADVVDMKTISPSNHQKFVDFLKVIQKKSGYPGSCGDGLIPCHERRPNNWGTMAGASRIALAIYIGDTADLAKAAAVYKGYIGDSSSHNGFEFQPNASKYACNTTLVPINPPGCSKMPPDCNKTYNMSGAPIDDVQRDMDDGRGSCPPMTNYAWGGLSGAVAQAEMLYRAGYDSYNWQEKAILRAMQFNTTVMFGSASSPTEWMPWIVQKRYGKGSFSYTPQATGGGRLMDWTDWTHAQ